MLYIYMETYIYSYSKIYESLYSTCYSSKFMEYFKKNEVALSFSPFKSISKSRNLIKMCMFKTNHKLIISLYKQKN